MKICQNGNHKITSNMLSLNTCTVYMDIYLQNDASRTSLLIRNTHTYTHACIHTHNNTHKQHAHNILARKTYNTHTVLTQYYDIMSIESVHIRVLQKTCTSVVEQQFLYV